MSRSFRVRHDFFPAILFRGLLAPNPFKPRGGGKRHRYRWQLYVVTFFYEEPNRPRLASFRLFTPSKPGHPQESVRYYRQSFCYILRRKGDKKIEIVTPVTIEIPHHQMKSSKLTRLLFGETIFPSYVLQHDVLERLVA